jgi:hypothetical protein
VTPRQIDTARALGRCSFLPGTADKRFARDLAFLAEHSPEREITERQALNLQRLAWKYRRQMPAALIPDEQPGDLPPKQAKPPATKPERRVPCLFDEAQVPVQEPLFGGKAA